MFPFPVRLLSRFAVVMLMLSLVGFVVSADKTSGTSAPVQGISLFAGKRVMVLGDSITQAGHYVSYLEYLLQKQDPQLDIDLISVGLSSETTSGLSEAGHAGGKFPRPCVHERLDRALAAVKPAVVLACYGMNDGIYLPYSEEQMAAFRDGVTRLAARCHAVGAQVILVTPPVYDNRGSGSTYDQVLAKFAAWEVASPPPGVVAVVDLHTLMAKTLSQRQQADASFHLSKDGIHPGDLGHLIMALAIVQGLNMATLPGTPDELLPVINSDPLFALVKKHRETRSQGWLQHIGYTREKVVPAGSGDINKTEMEVAQLQDEINKQRRGSK